MSSDNSNPILRRLGVAGVGGKGHLSNMGLRMPPNGHWVGFVCMVGTPSADRLAQAPFSGSTIPRVYLGERTAREIAYLLTFEPLHALPDR